MIEKRLNLFLVETLVFGRLVENSVYVAIHQYT